MITGITGAHWLIYSAAPEADRAFLRDALGLDAVDAGDGWLIFALPPSELAVHPGTGGFARPHAGHELMGAVLYLMCGDLDHAVASLKAHEVRCEPAAEAPWGRFTIIELPSGGRIGLYQPSHPTAV